MEKLITHAAWYNLPYPVIDAVVVDMLQEYTHDPPVPLVMHWRALSAGSSLHQITDVAGNEMLRAVVRLLPEGDNMVTIVNLQTKNARTANAFLGLLIKISQIVAQHRANLRYLQQQGVHALLPSEGAPIAPPPPLAGDDAGQTAILDWYDRYDPKAPNKEIAKYCGVTEQTIKNWRTQHGRSKRGKKGVL